MCKCGYTALECVRVREVRGKERESHTNECHTCECSGNALECVYVSIRCVLSEWEKKRYVGEREVRGKERESRTNNSHKCMSHMWMQLHSLGVCVCVHMVCSEWVGERGKLERERKVGEREVNGGERQITCTTVTNVTSVTVARRCSRPGVLWGGYD